MERGRWSTPFRCAMSLEWRTTGVVRYRPYFATKRSNFAFRQTKSHGMAGFDFLISHEMADCALRELRYTP